MKMLLIASLGFAALGALFFSPRSLFVPTPLSASPDQASAGDDDSALACDRTAFTAAEAQAGISTSWGRRSSPCEKGSARAPRWLRVRVAGRPPELSRLASEWVAGEHACLPLLRPRLAPRAGRGDRYGCGLTGGERGLKSFLEAEAGGLGSSA